MLQYVFNTFKIYAFSEHYFQRTPAKLITNTVIINQFAEKPDLQICLLRALISYIPFEAISCLGSPSRGWHDRWSDTWIVKKEEVQKLKELIEKQEKKVEDAFNKAVKDYSSRPNTYF